MEPGLRQDSLRQRSGLSIGSFLDSFLGGRPDSSNFEEHTPRQDVRRSPSFMDSTKSSQAHMHGQTPQAAAGDESPPRPAFRPSGVHLVISEGVSAEQAPESKAQHAQHGHAEHADLSPRSETSARSSSFMDSTQSSRAHHAEEMAGLQSQHDHGKHVLQQVHDHQASTFQGSNKQCGEAASSTVEQQMQSEMHSQPNHLREHEDASQSPHQQARHEMADERQSAVVSAGVKRGFSLSSKGRELGVVRRPSFMQPTASSLAHTATIPPASLIKSISTRTM